MKRGKNKEFIIAGVNMILNKNYNIYISDNQEIDTSLSISENINKLLNKYKYMEMDINDY
jgi:hypothetical protein